MFLFVLIFLITVIFGLVLYARWNFGVLEKMGLPMDKPHFILGNTHNAFDKPGGIMDIERFKKFGPVYGFYEGREAQIHVCHPDLIRLITSQDSDYFNDKRRFEFRDELLNEMPDFQPYEKWKAIRSFLTPPFSTAKIKMMSEPMMITLESFAKDIKNQIESSPGHKLEKYDLRDGIFVMITEMISSCCFSVQIQNASDPNNHFAQIVRDLLSAENLASQNLEIWAYAFPILAKFAPGIFNKKASLAFRDVLKQMIEIRRKSGEKKKDIVDLAIDLIDNKVNTPEFKRLKITETTIICQAFVFFFAGQDQISTISSSMIYNILKNEEIEKRLYEEVDGFLKRHNGKIEHENLSELTYLLACLNETLRLVPFFSRVERVCTKDWKNEQFNLDIKKGMVIQIPIWAANRNPEFFPDPEKFDPERFLPVNKEKLHPYAFTSFGFGPRNCIGMKFSYETLLLLSTVLLKNFKFHLRADSEPVFIPAGPLFAPHNPFYFDVTLRNK